MTGKIPANRDSKFEDMEIELNKRVHASEGAAPKDERAALCDGTDSVADLLLVECALEVIRDAGDNSRVRTDDERHLILTASINLLAKRIATLQADFDLLWSREFAQPLSRKVPCATVQSLPMGAVYQHDDSARRRRYASSDLNIDDVPGFLKVAAGRWETEGRFGIMKHEMKAYP